MSDLKPISNCKRKKKVNPIQVTSSKVFKTSDKMVVKPKQFEKLKNDEPRENEKELANDEVLVPEPVAPENADQNGQGNADQNGRGNADQNGQGNAVGEENREENSEEKYLNSGYCSLNNNEQYYAKDTEGNDMYWTNDSGEEIYAQKTQIVDGKEERIEFPACTKDGKTKYIYDRGNLIYPENLETLEVIFPKNSEDEEMYFADESGVMIYPKNKFGRECYRRDKLGNEVPVPNKMYATNADGTEIYPKNANGDEYYIFDTQLKFEIGAIKIINGERIEYYARKANGDEFYPRIWLVPSAGWKRGLPSR